MPVRVAELPVPVGKGMVELLVVIGESGLLAGGEAGTVRVTV